MGSSSSPHRSLQFFFERDERGEFRKRLLFTAKVALELAHTVGTHLGLLPAALLSWRERGLGSFGRETAPLLELRGVQTAFAQELPEVGVGDRDRVDDDPVALLGAP